MNGTIHESNPPDAPSPPDEATLAKLEEKLGRDIFPWFRIDTSERAVHCPDPGHSGPTTLKERIVAEPQTIVLDHIADDLVAGKCPSCGGGVYGKKLAPWVEIERLGLERPGNEPHLWQLKKVSRHARLVRLELRHADRRKVVVDLRWDDPTRAVPCEAVAKSCIGRDFGNAKGMIETWHKMTP